MKFDLPHPREYWDACTNNPYGVIRHGWTKSDFDTRTDLTLGARLLDRIKLTHKVLDVGCGLGYACKVVAPAAGVYVGVDWSGPILAMARDRNAMHHNALFVQNDGENLPFPADSFDAVFTEQMFYHVPRVVILAYLSGIRRVLKPHGTAILEIPAATAYVNGLTTADVVGVFPTVDIETTGVTFTARIGS